MSPRSIILFAPLLINSSGDAFDFFSGYYRLIMAVIYLVSICGRTKRCTQDSFLLLLACIFFQKLFYSFDTTYIL